MRAGIIRLAIQRKFGLRRSGRGDRIRTCDILLPKQARYRAALLPDTKCLLAIAAPVGPAGFEPAT